MSKTVIAKIGDLQEGQKKRVVVENQAIMLALLNGHYFAVQDECTHGGASLSGGEIKNFCVECPWHGARFDLRSGEVKALPAAIALKTFKVWTEDDKIWVEI